MKKSPFDVKKKKTPSKKLSQKKEYQKAINFESAFNNAIKTKEPLQEVGDDFFFIDLEPF